MEHKCFNCGNFKAFYNKGYCCFLRTDCGFCQKFNKTKQKHCSCENWAPKYYPKFKSGVFLKEMVTALTQINCIKLILDELDEELKGKK